MLPNTIGGEKENDENEPDQTKQKKDFLAKFRKMDAIDKLCTRQKAKAICW